MILYNFLFYCATKLQFLFQLSLKFAHLEVEIIVAQAGQDYTFAAWATWPRAEVGVPYIWPHIICRAYGHI